MEDLTSLLLALNDDQKEVAALSTLPFGSLSSLPPEIRLLIYEFSCGDIYTDENFKSQENEIANSRLRKCDCCGRHLPETGQKQRDFIRKIGRSRRGSRRRGFEIYFNLTLVNKAMYGEARNTLRGHYRSQLIEAHQVYYICKIMTSKPFAKDPVCKYTIAPRDSWAPRCSTVTALAALRLPKLTLAFCHGGLVKELGQALSATNATQSLRIHLEDAMICVKEVDFFEEKFAWTKQIEDTQITGRSCHWLWKFRADSKLSNVKKEKGMEDFTVPIILHPTLTGTLRFDDYNTSLSSTWSQWIVDVTQDDFERKTAFRLENEQRCWRRLGGKGKKVMISMK